MDEESRYTGGPWANAVYTNNEYVEPCVPDNATSGDDHCKYWAHMGVCGTHEMWMDAKCTGYCGETPFRYEANCQAWEDPECSDENCAFWASKGECFSNPEFMEPMCPIACEESTFVPPTTYVGCWGEFGQDPDFRYGPQAGEFTEDKCRDVCNNYPFFSIKKDAVCSCDYEYGDPPTVYP